MLIGLSGHSRTFASLAWIISMHEPVSQKTCGSATYQAIPYEVFTAGADRLEIHDQPSAHSYRQKGRDCLMTFI
jgi:hypothetical protein